MDSWPTIKGISWDLLEQQKMDLLKLLYDNPFILRDNIASSLEGIIGLIDNLQNDAEKNGVWVYNDKTLSE